MDRTTLQQAFGALASRLAVAVHVAPDQPALSYIELDAPSGYIRLYIDACNATAIVRTAIRFSAALEGAAAPLDDLLALVIGLCPAQSGRRFFPSLDMCGEHLMLSSVSGCETVRDADDLAALVRRCAGEADALFERACRALPARA